MNSRCRIIITSILITSLACVLPAQTPIRVGIFDSRAVAVAYAQSPAFGQEMKQLRSELQNAKTDKNDKLIAELEAKGQTRQKLLHLQGFSIGSVSEILGAYQEALATVAKESGVSVIVSQYEVAYLGPGLETVDVTEALVKKINDSPRILGMLGEMKKQKPLSLLDALSISPNE